MHLFEALCKNTQIAREIGNRRLESNNLNNIGNYFYRLQQNDKAMEYYFQALEISRDIGHRNSEQNRLMNIGRLYYRLNDHNKAIAYHLQALHLISELGFSQKRGICLDRLVQSYIALGLFGEGKQYMNQRIALNPDNAFTMYVISGVLALYEEQTLDAESYFQKTLDACDVALKEIAVSPGELLEKKAIALWGLRRQQQALATLSDAITQWATDDLLDINLYHLLEQSTNSPQGLGQMMDMLKDAQIINGF